MSNRTYTFSARTFANPSYLRYHYSQFNPMERQSTFKPRQQKAITQKMDEPQRTILLGKNVFVQSTLDGIQIKQYLSPDTSRTVVSLGSREFKTLVAF